ncbi:MAG: hypothetical protein K1X57_19550, partial [Gemmataceae bacterium]|nr:hypothetical protein [Gemmataceae bacterium]
AGTVGYTVVRLPFAVKELFEQWLGEHYPERKEKVLGRIRDTRNGELSDARFGTRMTGEGAWAEAFRKLFRVARTRAGIPGKLPGLSAEAFRKPGEQGTLF